MALEDTPVARLLKEKNIYYRIQGSDYLIKCLNPEHPDTNPSLRIDKVKGIGQCFSCSFKINLFQYFGVITNNANIKVAGLKEKIKAIRQAETGLEMLDGYTPVTSKFRGISVKTLTKFDLFSTDKVENMEDRIIVPIKDIRGRIKVFVGRHILSNANPRYMIYPARADMQLFPVVLETPAKSMVLVEGLFDMLNLYDKGLTNVVATLGTATLLGGSLAAKMLPFKSQGVSNIYICFDGDKAGSDAAQKLKPLLENLGFVIEIIELEEGTDPGVMDQEFVDRLVSYIKK